MILKRGTKRLHCPYQEPCIRAALEVEARIKPFQAMRIIFSVQGILFSFALRHSGLCWGENDISEADASSVAWQ
jgi:hypothetical protein